MPQVCYTGPPLSAVSPTVSVTYSHTAAWKLMILLTETTSSRLMLCHNARVTHVLSSRRYLSISRHLAKHREYSTVGYFGVGHIHLPLITVSCYSRPIVSVVTLLLCLLYKVNFMAGSAWTRKSPVYVGFVCLRGFRHPLGVSDHGPCR